MIITCTLVLIPPISWNLSWQYLTLLFLTLKSIKSDFGDDSILFYCSLSTKSDCELCFLEYMISTLITEIDLIKIDNEFTLVQHVQVMLLFQVPEPVLTKFCDAIWLSELDHRLFW